MTKFPLLGLATALLLAGAGQGAAQNTPSTDSPAAITPAAAPVAKPPAKNPRDPNQVICKTEDVIGTRLGGHRTCMTRLAWEQQAQAAKDNVNGIQSSGGNTNYVRGAH